MKLGGPLRALVLVAVLVVMGVAAFQILHANRAARRSRAVFPNGTRFTLAGTTIGTNQFTNEKPWHEFVRHWLPGPWVRFLPSVSSSSASGSTETLTVWFQLKDANGANANNTPWPWTWYAAVDDKGFHYPMNGGSGYSSEHCDIILQAFPRRQKNFELQFLDNNRQVVGSVWIPNPVRGPFPEWKPERMPITRTNGPIKVTLESLADKGDYIAPKWKLETTDLLWRGAKPSYFEFEDATGNRGGRLSSEERAWKLALPFRRISPKNYTDDEKFSLTNLAVPEPGEFQMLDTAFERLGVKFKVVCLAGVGTLAITNGTNFGMRYSAPGGSWNTSDDGRTRIEQWGSAEPFFLIETSASDPLDELRFRLTGPDGKEVKLQSNGWYGNRGGGRRYQERFSSTNEVGHVSLEVIVSRARVVEFIVDPAEVQRANSKPK